MWLKGGAIHVEAQRTGLQFSEGDTLRNMAVFGADGELVTSCLEAESRVTRAVEKHDYATLVLEIRLDNKTSRWFG